MVNDLYELLVTAFSLPVRSSGKSSSSLTPSEIAELADQSVPIIMLATAKLDILTAADREKTKQGILMVILAVQQYQREHGEFPVDSQALIKGNYLTEMPKDELQITQEKIRYRLTPKQFLVYSLGENGVDDGGNLAVEDSGDLWEPFDPIADDYGYAFERQQ